MEQQALWPKFKAVGTKSTRLYKRLHVKIIFSHSEKRNKSARA